MEEVDRKERNEGKKLSISLVLRLTFILCFHIKTKALISGNKYKPFGPVRSLMSLIKKCFDAIQMQLIFVERIHLQVARNTQQHVLAVFER